MKGKSLVVAILIVVGALSSFWVWQEGLEQQSSVDNIGFFKQQEEQLVIQYGPYLWWLSSDEKSYKNINLDSLGINARGDYDFFANGDLLIYHSTNALSFLDKLKQLFRFTKQTDLNTVRESGSDGFYRCQLSTLQCLPFGLDLPLLERSFRIAIDQQTDNVYLSDTSAHRLYKISALGTILASSDGEQFRFPNQLSFVDDALWIADTNHHRLASLNVGSEQFAQELSAIETKPSKAHRWPHQFAVLKNSVWINVADTQMSDGMLMEYDFSGRVLNQAVAEYVTDPLALITWQNKLWVADFASASIERFTLTGESLGLFIFPEFVPLLEQRKQIIADGKLLSLIGTVIFILTLLIGGIATWVLEKKESIALFNQFETGPMDKVIEQAQITPTLTHSSANIFWLENKILKHQTKYYVVLMITSLAIPLLFYAYILHPELKQVIFTTMFTYAALVILGKHMVGYLSAIKLGVQGERLFTEVNGDLISINVAQVFYSPTYLFIKETAIVLGNRKQALFDKSQLSEYVYTQLQAQNKLDRFSLFKRLWGLKEPLFMLSIATVLLFFMFILWR